MAKDIYGTMLEIEGIIANETNQLVLYSFGPHPDELEISGVGMKAERLIRALCAKAWEEGKKEQEWAHTTGDVAKKNPYE